MKSLNSKQREAKRQKRNQMILGIILIFVMFGSVFGIIVGSFGQNSEDNNFRYNGLEFVNQNGFWYLTKGNFNFVFRNNPEQISDLKINVSELKYLNNYYDKPLYLSPDNSEANSEIYANLNQIVQRMQLACLVNISSDCGEDLPIKSCENNFIIIKEDNLSSILQKENCVFIRGPRENLTQIADEFLFRILGVK